LRDGQGQAESNREGSIWQRQGGRWTGVPVRDTMEILGHSRIAVTLEIYTGADDASRRQAIERLNGLFGGRPA
jgi:hypothetical protein